MPGGGMGMQQGVRPGMPMEQDSQMVLVYQLLSLNHNVFKKGSCQLLAKAWAQELVNCSED